VHRADSAADLNRGPKTLTAKRVLSCCLAEDFASDQLRFLTSRFPDTTTTKGATVVARDDGEFFIFSYGVVVVWQNDSQEPDLGWLQPCLISPETSLEQEIFSYTVGDEFRIYLDRITLDSEETLCRLAVSHALAQSSKLSVFEARAKNLIGETQAIASELAQKGRISMRRRTLAKWQGKTHLSKSDILLRFDLLDTPEFFWDYPEYQAHYQKTAGYLELEQRLTLIQHKLNTVNDVLSLVADELRHQHSSALEWIIILLIAFEILVFIFHDWLGWI
jgi:uncharacterized Rmd1/YagE family protein